MKVRVCDTIDGHRGAATPIQASNKHTIVYRVSQKKVLRFDL